MSTSGIVQKDALTQMANRAGWLARVQQILDNQPSSKVLPLKAAVLFIDLDRFKWVNDSLGHKSGDMLLQNVARLIESCLILEGEHADIPGRLGGDEFVVWVQHSKSIMRVEVLANRIVQALAQPICLSEAGCDERTEVEIGASIGVAYYPHDAQTVDELLKQADLAMYRAKHSGRNQVVVYTPEMLRQIERRRQVQIQLRRALKQQCLTLNYTPIVDAKNQVVEAIEATLNVSDYFEQEGLDETQLLEIVESSQIGVVLGEWMISETIRFCAQLLQEGVETLCSIEVRPSLFQQKEFVGWLTEQLETYALPPEWLVLSLSEGCLNSQRFSVSTQLKALSRLGVEIAIRSFGSGNWSLLRLHDWPIDRLNLSAQFIQAMTHDKVMATLTETLIEMGLTLNKKVVACGVENAEHMAFLNSYGCHLVQGPYLSEALSEQDIEAYLVQNLAGTSQAGIGYYDAFWDELELEAELRDESEQSY